jgi:hypothetical protein
LERVPFARWQMGGDKVRARPCPQLPSARSSHHQGPQRTFASSINAMPDIQRTLAPGIGGLRARRGEGILLRPADAKSLRR